MQSTQPNKSGAVRPFVVAILAIALLGLVTLWLRRHPAHSTQAQAPLSNAPSLRSEKPAPPPFSQSSPDKPDQRIHSLQVDLAALDPATARSRLLDLRRTLSLAPTNMATAAIRQFLDSKADAPTHLGFKVARGGLLQEAPTLRTFLLDELERLDPAAAADYAKTVLASKDSPDEWAVALRNLARGDTSPEARALLELKTNDMLSYAPWQQNPSTGFLEAFDTAVYLGGTNLLPTLSDLVRKQDNPAVAHASFLALDRLVINAPSTTLAALESQPDMMQGREATRANYFARADVRDPQQRQILESYLLDPRLGAAELDTFAGIYPNANYMISENLLTRVATPDHASLVGRDAEALRVLQDWQGDPRYARLGPQLQKIQVRLGEFVRQANGR